MLTLPRTHDRMFSLKGDIRPGIVLRVIDPQAWALHIMPLRQLRLWKRNARGDWFFTIRYHESRQTKLPHFYRSHQWEVDLGRFEIVTDLQRSSRRSKRLERVTQLWSVCLEKRRYEGRFLGSDIFLWT